MKKCLIVFLVFIGAVGFSQTRVKADVFAFAFDLKHNVSFLNMFIYQETKFDLNKGVTTGIGWSNLAWGFAPEEHEFYNDFIAGSYADSEHSNVTEYELEVNAVDIPIGFNYYTKPSVYYTFTTHLNFVTNSAFSGYDAQNNIISSGVIEGSSLKKFYASYELSAMKIVSRRLEVGVGVLYGGGTQLFKDEAYESYAGYNRAVSKNWFFRMYLMRLYLWQRER